MCRRTAFIDAISVDDGCSPPRHAAQPMPLPYQFARRRERAPKRRSRATGGAEIAWKLSSAGDVV